MRRSPNPRGSTHSPHRRVRLVLALGALALGLLVASAAGPVSGEASPTPHNHGGWGAGDQFPDLPAGLFSSGTDMSAQELRAPFAAGEPWQVYSDENYPAELYGQVRRHDRFGQARLAFDIGDPTVRAQEVLAVGSGYAIAACLTEHMAIVVLEVQGHGRFLHAHMDRSELPPWLRTDQWTAVAQGQSLGLLWDNVYPNYVREDAEDGCYQVTFGEHLHLETPVGAVIDGMTVGQAAPNIDDVLVSTNVRQGRPTCEGQFATLMGSPQADVLRGTGGRDVIIGLGGHDTIIGLGGDDLICAGDGNDTIAAGGGDDRVLGEQGVDVLRGGNGNDELIGGGGADRILGGSGNDGLVGMAGSDVMSGGAGDDVLNGGWGNDSLYGGSGSDHVDGNAGTDRCNGGLGVDTQQACETAHRFP